MQQHRPERAPPAHQLGLAGQCSVFSSRGEGAAAGPNLRIETASTHAHPDPLWSCPCWSAREPNCPYGRCGSEIMYLRLNLKVDPASIFIPGSVEESTLDSLPRVLI